MTHSTDSTIDQAKQEISALREGLAALSQSLRDHTSSALSQLVTSCGAHLRQLDLALQRLPGDLEGQGREQEQLRGLFKVSQAISATLGIKPLLNLVMDTIIEVLRAERGFLLLFDPSGRELAAAIARNMDKGSIQEDDYEISRSISARVARDGAPVLTTNAQQDPRFSGSESVLHYQLRSIICVPLRVKERITGVVYVDNRLREGAFTERDRDLMAGFANQAAICIDNARLIADLQRKMLEIATMKNQMDNILSSIASGVIAIGIDGQVTAFNRAASEILGVPADQAMGRPCAEVLRGLHDPALGAVLAGVQAGEPPVVGRAIAAQRADGAALHLNLSASRLQDGEGRLLGAALVLDDQTEQHKLEAARQAQEAEKERIRHVFQRYVAPTVVERILSDPAQISLGGQRQVVTVLFADVRGFSPLSAQVTPEELVDLLNQHLALVADAVLGEEGTLDKYEGDAVMAIFNAPLPQPDHALRAARAALAMKRALAAHHSARPDQQPLRFGIGLHVGEAVVGNIGTTQMMNYTVIGDAVNLAKRLQECAAPDQILLSEALYERVRQHVVAEALPPLRARGHECPEQVYELLGWAEDQAASPDGKP